MSLYRNVSYLEYQNGTTVFNYGEQGELFYIILEGEVIIKVPMPKIIEKPKNKPWLEAKQAIDKFMEKMNLKEQKPEYE